MAQASPAEQSGSTPISAATSPNAQNSPASAPEKSAIIVTGIRRALQSARQRKKNADTVVDSIDANDIGAFPDKSVADALQRVPGITVNRFAATGDTAHFSAEPSGVIIRGLPHVRNELNGRDVFSANSGRGLSWSDIPAELLAGVDVYKNQTADLIEGGIAGSVNLRTRVPFDASGQLIQLAVKANYGDLSKKWTPEGNIFYSNRWQTGIGEFGLMGNIAYSQVKTRSQGLQEYRVGIFEHGAIAGSSNISPKDWSAPGTVLIPNQVVWRDNEYDRKRTGIAAAAQWRSNDHKWLATGQFLRSTYKTKWDERVFGDALFGFFGAGFPVHYRWEPGADGMPGPAPGTPNFTFDTDTGYVQNGTFVTNGGWWGNPFDEAGMARNSSGGAMILSCYTWASSPGCTTANKHATTVSTASRYNNNRNMTQDMGLNLKWEPTDRLRFNFDGQYVKSKIDNYDIEIDLNSFANVGLANLENNPRITGFSSPTNIVQSPGGLSNPDNWYINAVMDHLEKSKGHEYALRGDGEYDFKTDWLDSLKFGARWSDREQTVQWSTYNWHNVANTWTNGCQYLYFNLDAKPGTCTAGGQTVKFNGYPAGAFQVSQFGAPFLGGTIGSFPFVPFDFLAAHGADLFSFERTGVGDFVPICERNGQTTQTGGTAATELPNSCFTSDEIADVSEKTKAAYAMLKFGGDNAVLGSTGWTLRGNIGVRFVETDDRSNGAIRYPVISGLNPSLCPITPLVPGGLTGTKTSPGAIPPGNAPWPAYCYLTPQDLAFASGGGSTISSNVTHRNWLPSFNLRLDFSPKWLLRFAVSKAMSRPDIGLLKNFQALSITLPTSSLSDPAWIKDSSGNIIGIKPIYTADAFNPRLKPTTAWQGDLSLEHYFGNAGLFSFAVFYKKFYDYVQYGSFNFDITRNGVTRTVEYRAPANSNGAKIKGFEVAYNRFFDFLPKPFDGLGMQANYTYVKNSGISNANLSIVGSTPNTTNSGTGGTALNPGALEGLSKHTFNLVGLYEKENFPVSLRVAYNWRSKYLVTAYDCCVRLPVWQKAAGFLDASVHYKPTETLDFSLEASNLLNTKTVLQQQLTDTTDPEKKLILAPNAWFQNDRRFTVGVRWRMGK